MSKILADCGCHTEQTVEMTFNGHTYHLCLTCAKLHNYAMSMYRKYSEAANAKADTL